MGDRRLARETHIRFELGTKACSDESERSRGTSERERKGLRKKKGIRRYLLESRRDTKRLSAAVEPRGSPFTWRQRRRHGGSSYRVSYAGYAGWRPDFHRGGASGLGWPRGASRRYPSVDSRVLPPPSSPRVHKTPEGVDGAAVEERGRHMMFRRRKLKMLRWWKMECARACHAYVYTLHIHTVYVGRW